MEHDVTTISNGRIVVATIGETLSLKEWAETSIQIMNMVNQAEGNAHVIVDMRQTKSHPLNALEIGRVTIWARDPKIKTINHITENRITSILGEVVVGLVANTYKSMKTMDEALYRIVEIDETIRHSVEELLQALA